MLLCASSLRPVSSYRPNACYDEACQIEIGKEIAAEKTLVTKVSKLGMTCIVTMQLYDLRKSASEKAASRTGKCGEENILELIQSAMKSLTVGGLDGDNFGAKNEHQKEPNSNVGSRPPTDETGQSSGLPGTLDEAQLLKVIIKHKRVISDCMKKQQAANPGLGGVMQVSLVIMNNGRADRVRVAPPKFENSVVGNCVVKSVRTWSFPRFSGPMIPLDFPIKVRRHR